VDVLLSSTPLNPDDLSVGVTFTALDITDRNRAERDRSRLEQQFHQAQKLESIGRLAGGVAHDFNNLLMGIMNCVELCRDGVPTDHPVRPWLDEIATDAQRSASLTRQLLAFARKQAIAPQVLDLNDTIAAMLKMLRRLIGEDINLAWIPGANVWPIYIDPSQVDQILANLAVNARDAIEGPGAISIATENVERDALYCADHPDALPGEYVMLAVSDDGQGMTRDILTLIFEPFFTTKEVGKGTGLGLATVHGIVKQNNGFVSVYSEPGQGTTFRIHLPRYAGAAAEEEPPAPAAELPRGDETILLVEDEQSVRITVEAFLRALGYTVLVAASPAQAIGLADTHNNGIDMLITDEVMPGMSGRELADRLTRQCPGLRCLFMSGYATNIAARNGVLAGDIAFLSKPFSRARLAVEVRRVLDQSPGESVPA
jgi:signal transduction histidine kinase/ActR/RegA family two-component response regulator